MKRQPGLMFDISIIFLTFLLGYAAFKNCQALPKCHVSRFIYYKSEGPYILRGVIDNQPLLTRDGNMAFVFRAESMQSGELNHTCCGLVLVKLKERKDLYYGDELTLRGNLHRPFRPGMSGRGYADYLRNQNIHLIMSVKTAADVVKPGVNRGFVLKRLAGQLEQKMEKMIYKHASPLAAAVLSAMILGERKNIPWFVNDAMMKTGTLHILVVSGFNVGIIAFIVFLLLKIIRLPKSARFIIAIPLLMLYCLITGASNPVLRATIMAAVFILAYLLKREPDIYNALGIAAISILLANPRQLFDIGFQLSFASVLSIVYFYPKLKSIFRVGSLKIRALRLLIESCLVSLAAWLGTLWLIACYFKIFSPVTVLANLFIVPLAASITLTGLSLVAAGLISPWLASRIAFTAELEVFVLLKINASLLDLPFAYFRLPN